MLVDWQGLKSRLEAAVVGVPGGLRLLKRAVRTVRGGRGDDGRQPAPTTGLIV